MVSCGTDIFTIIDILSKCIYNFLMLNARYILMNVCASGCGWSKVNITKIYSEHDKRYHFTKFCVYKTISCCVCVCGVLLLSNELIVVVVVIAAVE